MNEQPSPSIHLWQEPDQMWRWRWVESDDEGNEQRSLTSHKTFDTESEAESSAREAFPGVPVYAPRDATAKHPRHPRRPRRLLLLLAAGTVAALGYRARKRRSVSPRR